LALMSQEHTSLHRAGQQEISLTCSLPTLDTSWTALFLYPFTTFLTFLLHSWASSIHIWTPILNYLHIPRHIWLSRSHLAFFRIELKTLNTQVKWELKDELEVLVYCKPPSCTKLMQTLNPMATTTLKCCPPHHIFCSG
jgi:hypothetical protein